MWLDVGGAVTRYVPSMSQRTMSLTISKQRDTNIITATVLSRGTFEWVDLVDPGILHVVDNSTAIQHTFLSYTMSLQNTDNQPLLSSVLTNSMT